jgi:hypothetical protein
MNDNSSTPADTTPTPPAWGRSSLRAAAIYNLVRGAAVLAWPHARFDLFDLPRPDSTATWPRAAHHHFLMRFK